MINTANSQHCLNGPLVDMQRQHVKKLYDIYSNAMKTAFDEGNHFLRYAIDHGDHDLNSALKIRSYHIKQVATQYQEFNIESLAKFFKVNAIEIRKVTNVIATD